MSKNISIAEGGVARQFTNDKLKINLVGGGTEYYVPESGVQLTTKSVTQNGTYKASDVGKYGFSQFSVNVPGGNGSADSHGKPNTSGDIKPGGAGSAVTGTDPETGEEVVVGVDENGNIVQTQIPYGIKIVTPPTKKDYVYQEMMDYSGIGVKLTNKNGDTYTDVDHPSGWYVNPADLIFPVEKAPAASGGSGASGEYDVGIVQPIPFSNSSGWYDWSGGRRYWTVHDIDAYTQIGSSGTVATLMASTNPNGYWFGTGGGISDSTTLISEGSSITIDGKTVYYYVGDAPNVIDCYPHAEFNGNPVDYAKAAWILCYGNITGGTATIPVKWLNPYTGNTHQDTFQITSTAASGDAHTSTGSSGTEGSGGGGTF